MTRWFAQLPLTRKVSVMVMAIVAAILSFEGYSYSAARYARVDGPQFKQVTNGKDLLADALPPPMYLIETFLNAYSLIEQVRLNGDKASIQGQVEHFKKLRTDYETRRAFWEKEVTDEAVRKLLLVDSDKSAMELFRVVEREFIPAVNERDLDQMRELTANEMRDHYEAHRVAVDKIVELTTKNTKVAEDALSEGVTLRGYGSLVVLTLVIAFTYWISRYTIRHVTAEQYRLQSMLDNLSANVTYADRNFKITYINPNALNMLRKVESLLPVRVDQIVGNSMDIFHKNPGHQRRVISESQGHPVGGRIQIGSEVFDLKATAVRGQFNEVVGTIVCWDCVTEKLEADQKLNEAAERERQQAETLGNKVDEILGVVDSAARGDLTRQIAVSGDDAIGKLGARLGQFFEDMRGNIQSIKENAVTLAGASEELSVNGREMINNADETAMQANAVSAASEQVTANMTTVSSGIDQMNSSIREIAKSASEASKVAQLAVNTAQVTSSRITKLRDSSVEIGNVVNVINSIAEQTKLLALNATIEAARAGEAGKGFAVVANEVKDLAKETADATDNISKRIEAIQADTTNAVDAIKEISNVINQINDISNTIASAVEEQTAVTSEIGRNVSESATGCGEIARSISAVANVAKGTTAGASNSQQAAVDLSKMAAELQQLVSHFIVDQPHGAASRSPTSRPSRGTSSPGKYRLSEPVDQYAKLV